jgi:acyl carrier protein
VENILERETIEHIVAAIVTHSLGVDSARITLTTDIYAELAIDSLDAIDLAMDLQEAFDIEMKDSEFSKYRTLESIAAAIKEALSLKATANLELAARGRVHEHAL